MWISKLFNNYLKFVDKLFTINFIYVNTSYLFILSIQKN